jgi:hypothetical protein
MGEYARLYTLQTFGVDIGDNDDYVSPKQTKKFGCSCGKTFKSNYALEMHQEATEHPMSKKQLKTQTNNK